MMSSTKFVILLAVCLLMSASVSADVLEDQINKLHIKAQVKNLKASLLTLG